MPENTEEEYMTKQSKKGKITAKRLNEKLKEMGLPPVLENQGSKRTIIRIIPRTPKSEPGNQPTSDESIDKEDK
jgi:hypothetical protein